MPLVRIDIMAGRPPEMIRELHSRVAELVAEILDTPVERVRTYITQFPPHAWGIGGVPADISRAADVEARRQAALARESGAQGPADPDTPDPDTPDPDIPDPGTPDPGTPDPGTPDPDIPAGPAGPMPSFG